MKIFIDADAFVALWNKEDTNYKRVKRLSRMIELQGFSVITSDFAFGEAITVISQKIGKRKAAEFINFVKGSEIEIVRGNEKRENEAVEWFKGFASKNTRFTDCLNMTIMKELGIKQIFSFDIHYKKAGFKRLGVDK